MELSATLELSIKGHRVIEIKARPDTRPDDLAEMLEDAVMCIQTGMGSMMEHGACPDANTSLFEWRYFNYEPVEAEIRLNLPRNNDEPPPAPGLSARLELWIHENQMIEIHLHPWTPPDSLAAILADLAGNLRKDFKNKTPILTLAQRLHEINTTDKSPTTPASFSGKTICDRIKTAIDKMTLAMDYGDDEAAQKYFDQAEKLYEWQINNYTPEAIRNGPAPNDTHQYPHLPLV